MVLSVSTYFDTKARISEQDSYTSLAPTRDGSDLAFSLLNVLHSDPTSIILIKSYYKVHNCKMIIIIDIKLQNGHSGYETLNIITDILLLQQKFSILKRHMIHILLIFSCMHTYLDSFIVKYSNTMSIWIIHDQSIS